MKFTAFMLVLLVSGIASDDLTAKAALSEEPAVSLIKLDNTTINANDSVSSESAKSAALNEPVQATTPSTTTPSSIAPSSTWATVKKVPVTECEKSFVVSDECLQNALFIGQQRADIPHSISHMDEYCDEKKKKFNCIKQYGSKCLRNVPRQIYLTITKNVRKMFKEFCDTDSGKNTFLKHLECVKPDHLTILNEVLGKLTLALEFVAQNVTRDKMITYACCALYKTYDEIPAAMGGICAPRPTPAETTEFFRSLIKRTVGDILDIGCGKFNSYSYCDQNFKVGLSEIQSYVSSGRPLPDNSFMIPLMAFSLKIDGN